MSPYRKALRWAASRLNSAAGLNQYIDATIEQLSSGDYLFGGGTIGLIRRLDVVRFAAAYACITKIANYVGRAELKVYNRLTGEEVKPGRANRGQVVSALIYRGIDPRFPNRELLSMIATDLAFDGSSYLVIRGSYAVPISLDLMQSTGSSVWLRPNGNGDNYVKQYWLKNTYGVTHTQLPENKVVHVNLLGGHLFTGQQGRIRSIGPVAAIGNAVRAGTSADEFVRKETGGEGLHNRLVYRAVDELDESQEKALNATWDAAIRSRSQRPLLLQNMGPKNEGDSLDLLGGFALQNSKGFNELRDYQVADVARAFHVPLSFLAIKGTNFGNALAEHRRAFVDQAVRPYMEAIETALTYRLLAGTDFEVRFKLPPALNTDLVAMASALPKLVGSSQTAPIITVAEAREALMLPRIEDPELDKLLDVSQFHAAGPMDEGGNDPGTNTGKGGEDKGGANQEEDDEA